jgi:hypothetical protein
MNTDMEKLKPSFDFITNESSILLLQSQAEVCINQNTYTGNGEVRLELLPRAHIYCYGYFQGVPAKDALEVSIGQSEILSFSINSRQIKGFRTNSGGDINSQEFNLKWCPRSEPINGAGDESKCHYLCSTYSILLICLGLDVQQSKTDRQCMPLSMWI